jgi:hypothetical protein
MTTATNPITTQREPQLLGQTVGGQQLLDKGA